MIGFAIGNGLSRVGFNLERLRGKGITIGCNHLYRDFIPDYLIALDVEMRALIDTLPRPLPYQYLSRRVDEMGVVWLTLNGVDVMLASKLNNGYNNNSGVLAAAYLAEVLGADSVYMLGIDYFRRVPGSATNDVYGGETLHTPTFAHPFNLVAHLNPKTKIVRVGPVADCDAGFYASYVKGIELIDYDEFACRVL